MSVVIYKRHVMRGYCVRLFFNLRVFHAIAMKWNTKKNDDDEHSNERMKKTRRMSKAKREEAIDWKRMNVYGCVTGKKNRRRNNNNKKKKQRTEDESRGTTTKKLKFVVHVCVRACGLCIQLIHFFFSVTLCAANEYRDRERVNRVVVCFAANREILIWMNV